MARARTISSTASILRSPLSTLATNDWCRCSLFANCACVRPAAFLSAISASQSASCPELLIVFATCHKPLVTGLIYFIDYLKSGYLRLSMGLETACRTDDHDNQPGRAFAVPKSGARSLPNSLKEPPIILADFPRLFEGTCPFLIEAPKVALDVPDIEFEITSDDVRVFSGCLRVTWHERAWRRITGLRGGGSSKASEQKYSQRNASSAQPWRVKPPQNLIEAGTHR